MRLLSAAQWSIASPLAGGAIHAAGSGLFHTLLPLRLVANGYSANVVGLVVMAEGAGFVLGCIGSSRLVRSVGEIRAYAAFSASSAVLLLCLGLGPGIVVMMGIQAVIGFANAGQAVIIESWLNALVSNENRGRVLTLYILLLGLFYGIGQLLARDLDPAGDKMLMISAALYTAAIIPVTVIKVIEPKLHAAFGLHFLRSFKTSPLGTFACLLTGLISATFSSIGPLYGLQLGFHQSDIVLLMAAVQLGALFLQFPLGFLSDRLDRRMMMLSLAVLLALLCGGFLLVSATTPFWLLLLLFSLFGGLSEIFYPLGVAHANDRAEPSEFIALSSNLLLVWALGSTFGPVVVTWGIDRAGAQVFFWYAIALCSVFAVLALWRSILLPRVRPREDFVAYPQTSPAVYEWVPHHQAQDGVSPQKPQGTSP